MTIPVPAGTVHVRLLSIATPWGQSAATETEEIVATVSDVAAKYESERREGQFMVGDVLVVSASNETARRVKAGSYRIAD